MSNEHAAESVQALGREVITLLHSLSRTVSLYEPNNNAVIRVLDALEAALDRYQRSSGGSTLSVRLLAEEFFVNGRLLRVDAQMYERAIDVAKTFRRFEVGELRFESGLTRGQLDVFTADLAKSVREGESRLEPGGYGTISVHRADGRSVASFRFQPHKLAKVLYGSLLDLVEKLYVEVNAGNSPSLLPVKRTLQLVIDAMADHGAMFQVLAAVHDPTRPVSSSRRRVSAAVDAIGFGYYLGLPKADLMYLALGAILGGLSDSLDPDEAISPLFRFGGLGDSAMPLILAVRDARAARLGHPGGVPGQMLAVVELFTELATASEARPAMSPHRTLGLMVGGQVPGVDKGAARVFADYKGPYPLGSAVRLSSGHLALVVGFAEGTSKQKPTVALLERGGSLGRRVNLAEVGDVKVASVPEPSEIDLNIAET